jgi:FdhD protein
MSRITVRGKVIAWSVGQSCAAAEDWLAAEEPPQIRVGARPLVVTMRTPGDDFDLAAGFLLSEGLITAGQDFSAARYRAGVNDDGQSTYNVLDVTLAPGVAPPDPSSQRSFEETSSRGLCGKASIDVARARSAYDVSDDALAIDVKIAATFPAKLRSGQAVFDKTGGPRAAALFDGVSGPRCLPGSGRGRVWQAHPLRVTTDPVGARQHRICPIRTPIRPRRCSPCHCTTGMLFVHSWRTRCSPGTA